MRDAEEMSAGLPLTLNIPPCLPKKVKRYKGKVSINHRSCTGIQIHRHWQFHHQFLGGLDHELYQMRRFRISEVVHPRHHPARSWTVIWEQRDREPPNAMNAKKNRRESAVHPQHFLARSSTVILDQSDTRLTDRRQTL